MKQGLVLAVTRPNVAHASNIWTVQVSIPTKKYGRIVSAKHWVFTDFLPQIGEWIPVVLL